jgi:hypothetical protein
MHGKNTFRNVAVSYRIAAEEKVNCEHGFTLQKEVPLLKNLMQHKKTQKKFTCAFLKKAFRQQSKATERPTYQIEMSF